MSLASLIDSRRSRRLAWAAVALLLWAQVAALAHDHNGEATDQHRGGACAVCSVATAAAPPPEPMPLPSRGPAVSRAAVVQVIADFSAGRPCVAHPARAPPVSIPRSA